MNFNESWQRFGDLKLLPRRAFENCINRRDGETKLGENIALFESDNLAEIAQSSATFVLLGVPESIGPMANWGRSGTEGTWNNAFKSLLNVQATELLKGDDILFLGELFVEDLLHSEALQDNNQERRVHHLRSLVEVIDQRLQPIIKAIVGAGKIPIVVGGGHNNALPIIQGTVEGLLDSVRISEPFINVINMDAHADFRPIYGGRHSGNPFSFAHEQGLLQSYAVIGLHENYNSQNMLDEMQQKRVIHHSYEDIFLRQTISFEAAVKESLTGIGADQRAFGLELDMDAIENMPSSAESPSGFSMLQARQYIHWAASTKHCAYLHLPEAASGNINSAKAIAFLITDFIKAHTAF